MVFGYKKNDKSSGQKVVSYRPNFLIIIGAILNIIFASFFSVLLITVVITIPTIVFNAMLFNPRISNKRYIGITRIIPVILSLAISIFVLFISVFGTAAILTIYNGVADVVNTVAFWEDGNVIKEFQNEDQVETWTRILFLIFAFGGNVFILIGWYKGKTLIEINDSNFDRNNLHRR